MNDANKNCALLLHRKEENMKDNDLELKVEELSNVSGGTEYYYGPNMKVYCKKCKSTDMTSLGCRSEAIGYATWTYRCNNCGNTVLVKREDNKITLE